MAIGTHRNGYGVVFENMITIQYNIVQFGNLLILA